MYRIVAKQVDWPRPIAALGASHPQSNFLLFSQLGAYVDWLVDDDPFKVGKFVPIPNPVEVIDSCTYLENHPTGTLVLTAFGQDRWMDRFVDENYTGLNIVDPYL